MLKRREDTLHLVEFETESGTIYIRAQPEEDLGMDHDVHSDFQYINKKKFYHDAQPVKIDELITDLIKLKSEGANYVTLDFHEDHQELEVTGFTIRLATDAEIDEHYAGRERDEKKVLESKIQKLEKELADLKTKSK